MDTSQQGQKSIGNRYQILDQIGAGGMGQVYRAFDRLTNRIVAVKRVTIEKGNSDATILLDSYDFRMALAREFQILASLRHPNIISVLDFGFAEDQQPYFAMEYLEGAKSIIDATVKASFAEKVDLLRQMLQALIYLHRRDMLHRDLKPDNVLVINGQVKVLDFGLAVNQEQVVKQGAQLSGTMAYLAPELFKNRPPTKLSDLYAVGMIAWEVLTGNYPIKFTSVNELLDNILTFEAKPDDLDLVSPIREAIIQLVAQAPEDRIQDVNEVFRIFSEAIGKEVRQDSTIRESFLQAAQFTGRENELRQLDTALSNTLQGMGSTWLVGGESGVGKSRLLNELRIMALVQGATVIIGQEVQQGGASYQSLRPVLRYLCLQTQISDVEASVIKVLVTDISILLGREIPDAPEIQPQDAQRRLLDVIQNILSLQSKPIVVILEDLQWSTNETLDAIRYLTSTLSKVPILVVGSYRNDERPTLPTAFPHATIIGLNRLDSTAISILVKSMLGEVGQRPQIIDLITRETEGNAFFIVEVVRALVEEVGNFADIGSKTLPQTVFSGGMKAFIQRRLHTMTPEARQHLRVAAVAGRELDLDVIQNIIPTLDLNDWLTSCADANILDVQDNRWRFAHDKLREFVLDEVPQLEKQKLHRLVAESIERIHKADLTPYLATLAYQWEQAHDVVKEVEYLERAGHQSLRVFADQEAVRYFTKALAVTEANRADKSLGLNISDFQIATWNQSLGEAYNRLGRLAESENYLLQSLTNLKHKLPQTTPRLISSLIKHLLLQTSYRLKWVRHKPGQNSENLPPLRLSFQIFDRLTAMYYYKGNAIMALYCAIVMLNVAEQIGPSPELSHAYSYLCSALGIVPLHGLARSYKALALETIAHVNSPNVTARVYMAISAYDIGIGAFEDADAQLARAIDLFERDGNWEWWGTCMEINARSLAFQGMFQQLAEMSDKHLVIARQREDINQHSMGLTSKMEAAVHLDDKDIMLMAAEVDKLNSLHKASGNVIKNHSIKALSYLWHNQWDAAEKSAKAILDFALKERPTSFGLLYGYAAPASVYLSIWEHEGISDLAYIQKQAEVSVKLLRKFANIFPIGMPWLLRCQGLYEWLSGKHESAITSWTQSLEAAQKMHMKFDEAAAYYELGRHLPSDNPQRIPHLTHAKDLFQRIGSIPNLQKAQAELETVPLIPT
jgi:eukaryotic-like serine/threonine-protein kinase